MKGIHLCTAVWGELFVNNYLNFTVKSIISQNNLPFLSSKKKIIYTIYTKSENKNLFLNSKSFEELKKFCNVKIDTITISYSDNDSNESHIHEENISMANKCYANCLEISNNIDYGFFWIHPDAIHAENNFRNLYKYIDEGFRIIYVPGGLRTPLNKIRQNLINFTNNLQLTISSRELVNLSIKNILNKHKNSIFYKFKKNQFQFEVIWPMKDIGVLTRSIVGQNSVFIYPQNKNEKYKYESNSIECSDYIDKCINNKSDIAYISDSSIFYVCPIENIIEESLDYEIFKFKKKFFLFNRPNKLALALNIIKYNNTKFSYNFIVKPLRYRIDQQKPEDEKKWIEIEKKTDKFSKNIYLISKILDKNNFLQKIAIWIVSLDIKTSTLVHKIIKKFKK